MAGAPPNAFRCYRMLRRRWRDAPLLERWRYLRSVAAFEHLHFRVPRYRAVPSAPLLRMRRFQLIQHFQALGYLLHPHLLAYALPIGPSGEWLEEICPFEGPSSPVVAVPPNKSLERTREG